MIDGPLAVLSSWNLRAEPGYADYWLTILATIFRVYGRSADLSTQERSLAWSMLIAIELRVSGRSI